MDGCGHCYLSRGGKSTVRVRNPQVGWVKSIEKGQATIERD